MKKVCKVLLILFLAAIWLNVGYWGGKNFENAQIKRFQDEKLGCFERFQLGGYKMIIQYSSIENAKKDLSDARILSCVSWPIGLIVSLGNWIIYGIVQAVVAAFHAVVWFFVVVFWRGIIAFLWNFLFCGGFFKLLGITSYHWILMGINLIAGVLLAQWGWHIEKKYLKPKNSTDSSAGMIAAIVSTIMCGFFAIFTLVFNATYFWTTFYTIWSIALVISLIFNIKKI